MQRLVARAFALGLDPELTAAARADHLARLAAGDREALVQAARHIDHRAQPRSPLADQAVVALEIAAGLAGASSRQR
jgi:hypothetical protein